MSEDQLPAVMCRWARHPRCVGLARMELRKACPLDLVRLWCG